jgi:hypothetical protein
MVPVYLPDSMGDRKVAVCSGLPKLASRFALAKLSSE